jgi:hypothetical protein
VKRFYLLFTICSLGVIFIGEKFRIKFGVEVGIELVYLICLKPVLSWVWWYMLVIPAPRGQG